MKVEVHLNDREHQFLGSNVSLRVGSSKTLSGFQLSKKSNCSTYERTVYRQSGLPSIREYSINVTPEKLAECDSDNSELKKFTNSHLSGIQSSPDVNLIIARIDLKSSKLGTDEIRMISDILNISDNAIIVPPFIDIKKGDKFNLEMYLSLIREMQDVLGKNTPMACPIPSQASRKDIREIMALVNNPSQIYVKDFFGQKIISPNNEMILSEVVRGIREKEKKDTGHEGSFLYAYDSRPNPKNGNDTRFVEAQIISSMGFNGVGPKRKPMKLTKELASKIGQSDPFDTNKLFNPKDYRLYTINEGTMTDQYSEFVYDRFGSDYRNMDSDHIRNSVAAFNHEQRVADLLNVDEAIKEDCYAQYVESKSTPEGMVKTIRKVTKKVISE